MQHSFCNFFDNSLTFLIILSTYLLSLKFNHSFLVLPSTYFFILFTKLLSFPLIFTGTLRSMGIHKRWIIYPKNQILLHFTRFQDYEERSRQIKPITRIYIWFSMCQCTHACMVEYFKLKPHPYKFISIFILSFSCIFYVK